MGMHQYIENLRREYSRVDAYVPCEYRLVLTEERPYVQARIAGDNIASEHSNLSDRGNTDPVLEEWLQILNSKLDTIIHLMKLRQDGYFELPYKAVNISGGGMSFSVPEAIPLGEVLEIKIMLTFQQPVILIIYGEVVKSDLINDCHFVAVHYIHMDDSIRDMIVRFVFEREREILRERRN
ncbi:MAG: PilZ domain-containing protein [Pseudomonadota bacterium]